MLIDVWASFSLPSQVPPKKSLEEIMLEQTADERMAMDAERERRMAESTGAAACSERSVN